LGHGQRRAVKAAGNKKGGANDLGNCGSNLTCLFPGGVPGFLCWWFGGYSGMGHGYEKSYFYRVVIVVFDKMTSNMTATFNPNGSFLILLNLTWVLTNSL
jgi:hypothetical protein